MRSPGAYATGASGAREGPLYRIETEREEDTWEVEALYDTSFAPGREALSSYRLRDGVPPVAHLCRVARDDLGLLAGAIRVWPVRVKEHDALLLGPIAVHPTRQGEGLGGQLIWDVLERAKGLASGRVLLVGDLPYYRRFGFSRLQGVEMPGPTNPDRILGCGDWTGVAGRVSAATSATP